jgi:peptidoglycan-N-acetylglucosamine deacetylase
MKPHATILWIASLFVLALCSCNKDKSIKPLGPGLFLSCDLPPHHWHPIKEYLKENNIKVTFYTESFQSLTDFQKNLAKEMLADGHEMGHHTATHPNLNTYLEDHSLKEYIESEILPMKYLMESEGFTVKTFAYPHGASTSECDKELLNYFLSIRKTYNPSLLKNLEDIDAIYYRYGQNEFLNAASIDKKSKVTLSEIFDALEKAKKSKQTIALYCHFVSFGDSIQNELSINESDLKAIINKAVELNLQSYTATAMSKSK